MSGSEPEPAWTHFLGGLRAFVSKRVPAQDVDDVTQDALMRIHAGAPKLKDAGRTQAWVYSVTRHAVADYYRKHRLAEVADPLALESAVDPASGSVERLGRPGGDHSPHEEVLSWLRPMAEQLPAGYREALLMADFEGRPQREVAEVLGLSLPGAKSRVQRARRMLAANLDRCCSVELGPDGRVRDFRPNASCDC